MDKNFDQLEIGGKFFNSRLMLGTGKYRTTSDTINSIKKSKCEIITVSVRHLPINLENGLASFATFSP